MNALLAADGTNAMRVALMDALRGYGIDVRNAQPGCALSERVLRGSRFVVLYAQRFDGCAYKTDEALSRYVLSGGGLLLMHGAIGVGASKCDRFLAHLAGGAIEWPVRPGTHAYFTLPEGHAIAEGTGAFTMTDDAMFLTIDRFAGNQVFLRQKYLNTSMPAGWARPYGLGRVVYLGPGHAPDAFQNEDWARLFAQACAWLSGERSGV